MITSVLTHIKSYFRLSELNTYILRTTGIAESRLFEKIERILEKYEDISVSFLPKITGVDIKLKIPELPAASHQKAKQLLDETRIVIGKYIYTETEAELQEILGNKIRLVDSAQTITEETGKLLSKKNIRNGQQKPPKYRYYVTDVPIRFRGIGERFLGRTLANVNVVKW